MNLECCDPGSDSVTLHFWIRYNFEAPTAPWWYIYDWGNMKVFDGTSWAELTLSPAYDHAAGIWYNTRNTWTHYTADVSDIVGPDFKVLFFLNSDNTVTRLGMYVDDVYLTTP